MLGTTQDSVANYIIFIFAELEQTLDSLPARPCFITLVQVQAFKFICYRESVNKAYTEKKTNIGRPK